VDTEPSVSQEDKTGYIFAAVVESDKINGDIIGWFPTTSYLGNKYVLVLYAYDTITTEPMKNRGDK
jgi:hypothetical protein